MDPLSSVLSLIKIQHAWSGKFEWGRNWCLSFGSYSGIHSYAVLKGECWLSVEGVTDAVHGKTGDSLLLPSGRPFRVGSDLNLPSLDINAIRAGTADQSLLQSYTGSDFAGIGGQFTLEETSGTLLTGVLPPILHIHDEKAKSLLRWTLEQLAEELEHDAPGGSLLIQQLSTVLLIQALRVHLVMGVGQEPGWLSALADRQIRVALSAMHNNPEKKWTLDTLARTAGMSRTGFAIRFKQLVSRSPLDYLAHWRMLVAMEKLRNSKDSLATIAAVIGYDSQSSFSTAFRRIMNLSPAQYGKQHGVKR